MSFSKVLSASLQGLEVIPVLTEVDLSNGLPGYNMVGYLSSEVKEACERVRTAIHNSGYRLPPKRTVVNLSPGSVKKRGTAYDLPIAAAILGASGIVRNDILERLMIVGEMGLDGSVIGVNGVLPIAFEAKNMNVELLVVPQSNLAEAKLVEGIRVLGIETLGELVEKLNDPQSLGEIKSTVTQLKIIDTYHSDFSDIHGQKAVKRAAEIAVAGHHNLLMIGPPGGGKSMIAKRIPSIFPSMTQEEKLQLTKIYSVAGLLEREQPLITERPFREVHQTITKSALLGGGGVPRPGEITLAHGGVLFLDEIAEFPRSVLETLRQPIEERLIRIARSNANVEFPADTQIVAATNVGCS